MMELEINNYRKTFGVGADLAVGTWQLKDGAPFAIDNTV